VGEVDNTEELTRQRDAYRQAYVDAIKAHEALISEAKERLRKMDEQRQDLVPGLTIEPPPY
jgi:uncharacterized protein YnzC (UPF0291/DUF896 family)